MKGGRGDHGPEAGATSVAGDAKGSRSSWTVLEGGQDEAQGSTSSCF